MSTIYEDLEQLREKLSRLSTGYNEMLKLLKEILDLIDTIDRKFAFKLKDHEP